MVLAMNHYDDLQRFKDKTRSQLVNYKDLSAQSSADERGDWAILNQLSPTRQEPGLAMGGHVSSPVPKSVAANLFSQPRSPESLPTPVAPPPHERSPLMQSVAQRPAQPQAAAPAPLTLEKSPVVSAADTFASPPAASAEPSPAVVPQPQPQATVARPRVVTPPPESVNYSRLFAPKVVEPPATDAKTNEEKTLPLKSLLERIASCR